MKSIHKLITILSIGMFVIATSCSKTIDVDPVSVITTNSFWKTEDDVNGGLSGMYLYLRQQAALNLFIWGEARSNDLQWGQVSGTLDYDFYYNNTLTANSAGPSWLNLYTCINASNLIIKYAPGITFKSESQKNNILAQAYTMRAFVYFVMARTWGGVPIRTEPIEGYDEQTIQKERASTDEVFSLIKADLEQAIQLFPDNSFQSGRNKWSKAGAYALKADVYLWTGKRLNGGVNDFTTALDACNQVAAANVDLLPNYADLFTYANKGNKEVIMAVGFKAQEAGSANTYFFNMYSGPTASTIDPQTNEVIGQTAGGVVWTVTPLTQSQFAADDLRRGATFMEIPYSSYYPPVVLKGRGVLINGIRYFSNDVVLYRYADVLLMRAEAKNALDQDPSEEINQVRQRAYGDNFSSHVFVSGGKENNDKEILQERFLELAVEGKRWWDLVRFGKAFDLVPSLQDKVGKDHLLVWPIGLTTLSLEPKVEQNPGWQ